MRSDLQISDISSACSNPLPIVAKSNPSVNHNDLRSAGVDRLMEPKSKYILMTEPDHIFVIPLPNLACGGYLAAFPFFYIKLNENKKLLSKFYPKEMGPVTNTDPIGNLLVIIKKDILEKIAPTWTDVSLKMKDGCQTDKAFGLVLEILEICYHSFKQQGIQWSNRP